MNGGLDRVSADDREVIDYGDASGVIPEAALPAYLRGEAIKLRNHAALAESQETRIALLDTAERLERMAAEPFRPLDASR